MAKGQATPDSNQTSENVARGVDQSATTDAGTRRSYETGSEQAETGMGERAQLDNAADSASWRLNAKRTYDEYQDSSLTRSRFAQSYLEGVLVQHNDHVNRLRIIAERQLSDGAGVSNGQNQDTVNNAKFTNAQVIRHNDIAIDGQWNPVQQGAGDTLTARAVSIDDVSLKAIGAVVAAAVAESLAGNRAAK